MKPLVTPVEKKGRFSEGYAMRFICFDPSSRMVYLSDVGSKVRFWKHQMKLYSVVPKLMEAKEHSKTEETNVDCWSDTFDANELLTFTLHGVSHHKLDPDNVDDRRQMESLPNLLQISFDSSGNSAGSAPTTTGATLGEPGATQALDEGTDETNHYVAGSLNLARTANAVCIKDDNSFFGKDRASWQLRCPYFSAWEEMMLLMRDVLIADGLRYPAHGNFPHYADPRNQLPLFTLPLYLRKPFYLLNDAIVYACVHGRMVGCSPQGTVGVCMRHCFICLTDQDVLFMSETGQAVRWLPVRQLERVEYSLTGASSLVPPPAPSPAAAQASGAPRQPFCAFVAKDGLPDVLWMPSDPFTRSTASPSMAAMIPSYNVGGALTNMVHILKVLTAQGDADNGKAETGEAPAHEEADADIDLGDGNESHESYDADLQLPEDDATGKGATGNTVPKAARAAAPSAAPTAAKPSTLITFPVDPSIANVEAYCAAFEASHGRAFKWQPLAGTHQETPSVLQASVLAARLKVPQPEQQPVALREEFQPFYYVEGNPQAILAKARQQEADAAVPGAAPGDMVVDDLYKENVPVKRASKLLNILSPDRRLLLA